MSVTPPYKLCIPPRSYRHVLLKINHKAETESDEDNKKAGARARSKEKGENQVPIIMQVRYGKVLGLVLCSKQVDATSPYLFAPPVVPVSLEAPVTPPVSFDCKAL